MTRAYQKNRGMTLIELVITLALIAIVAASSTFFVGDKIDNIRYENTRKKMEAIRTAIYGNEAVDNEGHRTSFGYFGDMGGFPSSLTDLTTQGGQTTWAYDATLGIGAGWRGPYYNQTFATEFDVSKDEWGTAFSYRPGGTNQIISYGADKVTGGSGYAKDLTMEMGTDGLATIHGFVMDGNIPQNSKTVEIDYPSSGSLTSTTANTDSNGGFSFSAKPKTNLAFQVTTDPTLGPKTFSVDKSYTFLPPSFLNYNSAAGIVTDGLVTLLDAANYTAQGWGGTGIIYLTWSDLMGLNPGTLSNFNGTASSGWRGTGTTTDIYRLVFDSTNDYVTIPDSLPLNPKNITVCALVNFTSLAATTICNGAGNGQYILFKSNSRGWAGWFEQYTLTKTAAGKFGFGITDAGSLTQHIASSATSPVAGTWYHVCGTFTRPTIRMYVNGAQDGAPVTHDFPMDKGEWPVTLGSTQFCPTWDSYFNGSIAHVAIYNRELMPKEISQNCKALQGRYAGSSCN
jgi:prepilin-type N-terminal cleavage/methylation domain-containing protein